MGCDIHLVLERKNGSKWVAIDTFTGHQSAYTNHYSSPVARTRNYERFGALANVRHAGPEPRGVPADISETTAALLEEWEGDAHSMSWLPLNEATELFLATEHGELEDFANKYPQSHYFGVDESSDKPGQYRIVFWFDN